MKFQILTSIFIISMSWQWLSAYNNYETLNDYNNGVNTEDNVEEKDYNNGLITKDNVEEKNYNNEANNVEEKDYNKGTNTKDKMEEAWYSKRSWQTTEDLVNDNYSSTLAMW